MDDVSRVREKIDIVSFISEYIPLKKAGRNFKAPCPFHNEKSPSFVVSPERQIWHCFGCGKGGDVFTFLMEYDNMEFVEALRTLAKKAGIPLAEGGFDSGVSSKKEKIYQINKLTLDFYQYLLTKHNVGKIALEYLLKERKLTPAIMNTFSLGFSPKVGNALCNYLINKKKYKREDLIEAGLATYQNSRLVDFFRGRIMFPLFDHRDNVVGFAARVLKTQNIEGSKYINSRETLVYHKGELFFGLNIAKEEIKREQQAIVVEGELDAISCFMQGVKNVVAIKGTALTEKQAVLIGRFSPKVTLCLDMDSAGFEATKRSLPILEKAGLTTTVIVLP
ncbi:MAG: DNA primase, partial [Candidatus Levyibacteriota bacterium]